MQRSLPAMAAILGCLLCVGPRMLAADAAKTPAESEKTDKADEKGWFTLFDGKTLEGWTPNENKETWSIKDGELVAHGERSHLFYTGKVHDHVFKNFELKLEIMTKPHSNSGVYLHTKYLGEGWPAVGLEVQVNNTHDDPRKTAGLYRAQDIMDNSPAKDNEWFTMDITVIDKHAVIKDQRQGGQRLQAAEECRLTIRVGRRTNSPTKAARSPCRAMTRAAKSTTATSASSRCPEAFGRLARSPMRKSATPAERRERHGQSAGP